MKPLKLIIEGINSFTDAQELDFEAVGRSNLFCICGKTGAGKTTIFDSIMLALYGKSGKGNLADTVNLSRTSGSVVFEFESGGDIYRVERTIKCRPEKNDKGEPTGRRLAMSADCMLYKNGAPEAKGSDDVTASVVSLVGLEVGEFKNVYLLEQGEYAEFLKKPPAKQLETVGKIFSLMRFGDVFRLASEKKKESDISIRETENRIADLGDVGSDGVRAAKQELSSLKSKSAALVRDAEAREKELDELGKLRDLYLKAAEKQKTVADHVVKLDEAKEKLKSAIAQEKAFSETDNGAELQARVNAFREKLGELIALNALDRECAAAISDCNRKAADLEKMTAAANKAEALLKEKEDAANADKQAFERELNAFLAAAENIAHPSDVLARAASALKTDDVTANAVTSCYYELRKEKDGYDELIKSADEATKKADELCRKIEDELKKTEAFANELSRAEENLNAAITAESEAERALSAARLASHAAAVSAELQIGDRCPVCGGVYHGGAHEGEDVEQKKREQENAVKARKEAEKRVSELKKHVEIGNAEYVRISHEEQERREKAKELNAKALGTGVTDTYNEMLLILSRALANGEKSEKSRAAYSAAVPAIAEARAEAQGAEKALKEAQEKAKELCDRLGDMRGKTDAEISDIKKKTEIAEKEVAEHDEIGRKLSAEKDAAAATVSAVEELLEAARRDCPIDMPEFDEEEYTAKKESYKGVRDAVAACNAEIARKEADMSVLEQKLDKLKSLKAELDGHQKRSDIYKIIADMTKAKAMLNFVATEYIQDFTATASDILGRLSGGKYSMRYESDNGFVVSDYLNDGKTRKTDTLSGGELFLASLAVAIAISREQSAGDNAFFFLDEGFGTLDEELIDTVYGALEELSKNCLVGVISHSNALIDLMPSCVEVIEANDTVGSRIRY